MFTPEQLEAAYRQMIEERQQEFNEAHIVACYLQSRSGLSIEPVNRQIHYLGFPLKSVVYDLSHKHNQFDDLKEILKKLTNSGVDTSGYVEFNPKLGVLDISSISDFASYKQKKYEIFPYFYHGRSLYG